MNYVELNIPLETAADKDEFSEILVALLSDYPFDSFSTEKNRLKAYIPKDALADCKDDVDELLRERDVAGASYIEIEDKNWNELWESNFQPVEIDGLCTVRAPFSPAPSSGLDIVITPKMSFGTGHHATTCLIVGELIRRDIEGKSGLDMGSGTGVLAIVSVKRGAAHMDAVDIDDWAYENCIENCGVNGVADRITIVKGDVRAIPGTDYDFILANINRNILLADMAAYVATLKSGGLLIMSGLLEDDKDLIDTCAVSLGLLRESVRVREGWVAMCYTKPQ